MCAGVAALAVVVGGAGLLTGPIGAGDNGDGYRLYCGAGLTPLTPDGASSWKGGVVLRFATGKAPCPDPPESSALTVLRLASAGAGPEWSLTTLGWWYAVGIAVVTAVAAGLVLGGGPARLLVLVPPLVPLALPAVSRFFVSTYSEPAGLLGTVTVLLGAGVVAAVPRERRAERIGGMVLTAVGGVVAASAKPSFAPLLAVAAVVCATAAVGSGAPRRLRAHLPGVVTAGLAVAIAVGPVLGAVQWQRRNYEVVNTHNLVFTLVLPEVGPAAVGPLGLPPAAAAFSGLAYYPEGSNGYPGSEVVERDADAVRSAAYRLLVEDPGAVARAVGTGLVANLGARLEYLPSEPLRPGAPAEPIGRTVGPQGANGRQLSEWLDGLPVPWLPAALVVLGVLAGVGTRRSGNPVVAAAARVAAAAAVSALLVTAAAVLGDGYFEIAKHVWLSAYCLAVAVVAVVTSAAAAVAARGT